MGSFADDPIILDDALWIPGQPSDEGTESNTLEFWKHDGRWGMDDAQDSSLLNYICEYEIRK